MFPQRQVKTFRRMAHTEYIFPTLLSRIFQFFLKSINFQDLATSLNNYSTASLTLLLDLLNACILGVDTLSLNGRIRRALMGQAGSPQMHISCPPPLVRMYGDSRQAVIVSLLKSQNQAACPLQKNNILQCFDFVIMVKK